MNRLLFLLLFPFLLMAQLFEANESFVADKILVVKLPQSNRTSMFPKDAVLADLLDGKFNVPTAGQKIDFGGEESEWQELSANEDGWFEDRLLAGAYAYLKIELNAEQDVLLEGLLHDMVYVNGTPRIGNRYQWKEEFESWEPRSDYSLMPVKLNKGVNHLLFRCSRGGLKIKIHPVEQKIFFNINDRTYPDLLIGENVDHWVATIIVNASDKMLEKAILTGKSKNGLTVETEIPAILPYSLRKIKFKISGKALLQKEEFIIPLSVRDQSGKELANTEFPMRAVDQNETYRRTFISGIDGSVQYYAVNEARKKDDHSKALYLSLHGANVEAWNQANAYFPKMEGHIISPTNRRPFGYNWEDWGRIDALEVLRQANKNYNIAADRVYLTGHSMGGHGTWIIGATYPGSFASIGPSAGWISFWTYRFRDEMDLGSDAARLLMRSANPHNTFALAENFTDQGIYILHGQDDDNVRIDQAYKMIDRLKELNKNYLFHEEPDAGHWWDNDDAPGAQCVDWPQMFDYFNSTRIAQNDETRRIKFLTFDPGISAWNKWIGIYSQQKQLEKSVIDALFEPGINRFKCTTENVECLAVDVSWMKKGDSLHFILDKTDSLMVISKSDTIYFKQEKGRWDQTQKPSLAEKGPHRNGAFKYAFNHNVVFVVGTAGNAEENKWAIEKARYDAETFWYQGNASIDIIPDTEFSAKACQDRSVILYGNSETNTAWKELLADSPVQVYKDRVRVGEKVYTGSDLAILMIRPRTDSKIASVGIVSGSGIQGMRLTDSQPYLYAGHGFPDCIVFNSLILSGGEKAVKAAGFFDNDWSLNASNFLLENE
ncbi:MAG: prolyl oligopeptidase family serine peptidase [Calditrichae bacterium]|nr:prolyl oligopeptidase family serine peptidase [Calditrichia bacterium]